ncbi:hypothetical protein [Streptomyces microflavus]|uniref:hypothetical protein n=1 Tax=Streptomyces microflavus TaxID=1919 RepID=UPI00386D6A93|nr:hypothetical protein OG269_25870 [Streptomyces microflavus]
METWIRFWTAVWLGCSAMSRRTVALIFCTAPATPTKEPAPTETAGEQPEEAPQEKPEKGKPDPPKGSPGLRILCTLLACGFIYGLPWTTRITIAAATAWTITALALGYITTLPPEDKKPTTDVQEDGGEAAKEPTADDQHPSELLPLGHVAALLSEAYTEGSGVHLAHLADRLTRTPLMGLPATPWKTAHVRTLLARHGVRVRPGVRVPPVGGREGVHREDFPPLPPTEDAPPVAGVVVPGQPNNNNAPAPPYRITDDPDNPARHHVHHERA